MALPLASSRLAEAPPQEGRILPAWAFIGYRWISVNPAVAIAPVLVPFIFLYFLRLISPAQDFPGEIVGAMIFTTQNVGNWVLGDSAWYRIENALQDLFVASPMGKVRYLMGIALANLIAAVPALVVLGLLLYAQPDVHIQPLGWIVLAGVVLLMWVLFSSLGIAISSRIRSRREVWPVGQLLFTAMGMISPLYYSITILPYWWQVAAQFLPGTYAATVTKTSLGVICPQGAINCTPPATGSLIADSALLVVITVIGIVVSMSIYRWGDP